MISLRNVLLLTTAEAFAFGAACLVALCWFAFVIAPRVLMLALDALAWCEQHLGSQPKIVDIEDHRRRRELDAATGRRAS